MKSDYFRLCRALVSGGLYVDAAIRCLRSPEMFFDDAADLICVRWWHGRIVNGLFSAPPGSPVIQEILVRVDANMKNRISNNVWQVTGPGAWIDCLNENKALSDRVKILKLSDLAGTYIKQGQISSTGRGSERHWSRVQKTIPIFKEF